MSISISAPIHFIKKEWVGIKEGSKGARRIIRIISLNSPHLTPKLAGLTARLSLLMGIETLNDINNYSQTIRTFIKNIHLRDYEGSVLSAFSVIIGPGVIIDTCIPFARSLTHFRLIRPIPLINVIEAPLALGLLTYASCRGTYDNTRLFLHMMQLPHAIDDTQKEKLQNRLKELFADAKNVNILTRHTNQNIVAVMRRMKENLEANGDAHTVNPQLAQTHVFMRRKLFINTLSTYISIAMGTAVAASLFFQASPFVIPTVALVRSGMVAGKHYYERTAYSIS